MLLYGINYYCSHIFPVTQARHCNYAMLLVGRKVFHYLIYIAWLTYITVQVAKSAYEPLQQNATVDLLVDEVMRVIW